MVKPDGVARNIVGEIISRFEVRTVSCDDAFFECGGTDPLGDPTAIRRRPQFIIDGEPHTLATPPTKTQRKGFKLVGLKLMHASKELLSEHYQDLVGWVGLGSMCGFCAAGSDVGRSGGLCIDSKTQSTHTRQNSPSARSSPGW